MFVAALLALGACSTEPAPEVPPAADGTVDPVLVEGRTIWEARCANCHGSDGGGNNAPALAGRMVERYPDPADQIALVAGGRGGMPAFGNALDDDELTAVVRYTREVLDEAPPGG